MSRLGFRVFAAPCSRFANCFLIFISLCFPSCNLDCGSVEQCSGSLKRSKGETPCLEMLRFELQSMHQTAQEQPSLDPHISSLIRALLPSSCLCHDHLKDTSLPRTMSTASRCLLLSHHSSPESILLFLRKLVTVEPYFQHLLAAETFERRRLRRRRSLGPQVPTHGALPVLFLLLLDSPDSTLNIVLRSPCLICSRPCSIRTLLILPAQSIDLAYAARNPNSHSSLLGRVGRRRCDRRQSQNSNDPHDLLCTETGTPVGRHTQASYLSHRAAFRLWLQTRQFVANRLGLFCSSRSALRSCVCFRQPI